MRVVTELLRLCVSVVTRQTRVSGVRVSCRRLFTRLFAGLAGGVFSIKVEACPSVGAWVEDVRVVREVFFHMGRQGVDDQLVDNGLVMFLIFACDHCACTISIRVVLCPFTRDEAVQRGSPNRVVHCGGVHGVYFAERLFQEAPVYSFRSRCPRVVQAGTARMAVTNGYVVRG